MGWRVPGGARSVSFVGFRALSVASARLRSARSLFSPGYARHILSVRSARCASGSALYIFCRVRGAARSVSFNAQCSILCHVTGATRRRVLRRASFAVRILHVTGAARSLYFIGQRIVFSLCRVTGAAHNVHFVGRRSLYVLGRESRDASGPSFFIGLRVRYNLCHVSGASYFGRSALHL